MSLSPRLGAVAVAAAMAVTACGGDEEPATTTTTSPPTTSPATTTGPTTTTRGPTTSTTTADRGPQLSRSCTHDERGVRIVVRYPQGWSVNSGDPGTACTAFDPDPIDLRAATELPRELAVTVRVEPVPFDLASRASGLRVESETRTTIDGRTAVRQEVVTTGEGLGPAGERAVRYVIDGGADRSILVTTWDVEGNDFQQSQQVLDAMARALDITPRRP